MIVSEDQPSPHHIPPPCWCDPSVRTVMDDTRRMPVKVRLWPLLLMSLLVMGCASTPVHTDGVAGAVAWHATDFQLAKATVQGQPGERYAFTLVLSDRGGTGVTFTDLQRTVSAHQVHTASTERTGRWRLPPNGELRLPFSFTHYCSQAFDSCSGPAVFAPHWHIVLTGADDRGHPVQVVIDLDAPPITSESRAPGEQIDVSALS
jgi:hypothetical protein